jgi:DNA-binding MarR family transcriptional regulator
VSSRSEKAAAAAATEHLEAIRRMLRDAAWAEAGRLRVPLTAPQLLAVQVLVAELRASNSGLSLSELSRRMGLAHSTVSGIVDRLEQREFVRRVRQRQDRRFVSIELSPAVSRWLKTELPKVSRGPIVEAFERATPRERDLVVAGLETLHQLLMNE